MGGADTMKLILKNIRCFSGEQSVPIYPLTILVGENSTGKTTLLAALSCLSEPDILTTGRGFNLDPYNLGGYENIAAFNPKTKRYAREFKIGFSINEEKDEEKLKVSMAFKGQEGKIIPYNFELITNKGTLHLKVRRDRMNVTFSITDKRKKGVLSIDLKGYPLEQKSLILPLVYFSIHSEFRKRISKGRIKKDDEKLYEKAIELLRTYPAIHKEILSLAPVRTKPRRYYDVFVDEFNPEGDHIPIRLARFLQSSKSKKEKDEIQKALNEFGSESGLYDKVHINRLGDYPSAPFQILVNIGGRPISLADVGYGVSQCLPIVIQSILEAPGTMLLQQQPEVHLHPRAQAALGSLFAKMVETTDIQFIVETHSDYLIDRVRQEIAHKNIDAEKVGILFFDKKGPDTKIHPLALDDNGNILNAPKSYREFFLEEELKL